MNQNQPNQSHLASEEGKLGRLTLVGTPIGNLDDITFRALKVMTDADVLLCEDTRRTLGLLNHFKIIRNGPVLSFHDHSGPRMIEKIREYWGQGAHIAYVTDGGMPGVSDPGYVLVRLARQLELEVSMVPGPTAVTAFFAICGLGSPKFMFHGFFPRTRGEIEKVITQIKEIHVVHIFYEAPYRVQATFEVLNRNFPESQATAARELTKIHEEIFTGEVSQIFEHVGAMERVRGEWVFGIIGGSDGDQNKTSHYQNPDNENADPASVAVPQDPFEPDPAPVPIHLSVEQKAELTALLQSGIGSKEAAKQLSKKFGVTRKEIYDFIVKHLT